MPAVIEPAIDQDNGWFWAGVADGKLLLQRCAACGRLRRPGVPMCGECHATDTDVRPASGRGTVHSWILSHHPTAPDAEPRLVALVELEEGVRLVSNLVDCDPGDVSNDAPVELCFRTYGDVTLPQFRLVR